ncbi:MAG: FtsL-like putative cell division protein [Bacteroidota bacterium]
MANKFRDIPIQTEALEQEQSVVEEIVSEKVDKLPRPKKKGVLTKGLTAVFSGTFLANPNMVKHLPYVLFLAVIAIFYIGNGYYADSKIREVNKITNELKELKTKYISTTSDLMFASKQSEVAKSVAPLGLKESVIPPNKIVVDSSEIMNSENKSGE